MVTSGRFRSTSFTDNERNWFIHPRILKEPVYCMVSNLRDSEATWVGSTFLYGASMFSRSGVLKHKRGCCFNFAYTFWRSSSSILFTSIVICRWFCTRTYLLQSVVLSWAYFKYWYGHFLSKSKKRKIVVRGAEKKLYWWSTLGFKIRGGSE